MQFEPSSVQLSATITELIEHMRQAAYDEGYEDARGLVRSDETRSPLVPIGD
jgi:hypothetical protein